MTESQTSNQMVPADYIAQGKASSDPLAQELARGWDMCIHSYQRTVRNIHRERWQCPQIEYWRVQQRFVKIKAFVNALQIKDVPIEVIDAMKLLEDDLSLTLRAAEARKADPEPAEWAELDAKDKEIGLR